MKLETWLPPSNEIDFIFLFFFAALRKHTCRTLVASHVYHIESSMAIKCLTILYAQDPKVVGSKVAAPI